MAFLVAPAAPVLGYAVYLFVTEGVLVESLWLWMLALAVSYSNALFLGVPAIWVLRKLNILKLPYVVTVAFLIGALPIVAIAIGRDSADPLNAGRGIDGVPARAEILLTDAGFWSVAESVLTFGVAGAVAGLVWWYLSGCPRKGTSEGNDRIGV